MLKYRLIAVLIVADGRVVQSIRFKHTNVIHADPIFAIESFNKWAVDEIVLLNVSRDRDSQAGFAEIVDKVSRACFVPLAVGGWIDSLDYARQLLNRGADKLVVNTALADDPELFERLAARYGRQCMVASIDVKRGDDGRASVHVDRGRRDTGQALRLWAEQAIRRGAGEIFFNSIDHDGARRGYDLDSIAELAGATSVPVIAFGGVFTWKHLVQGIHSGADAVAAANIFHYTEQATRKAKAHMAREGIRVRQEGQTHAGPS